MFEPRAPLENEVHQLIGFLDKNLRQGSQWSIASEYPNVFTPGNRSNIRVIWDDQQVLAHAAIRYLYIRNVMGIFKVAAIGSVVTDPNFRNQGLSQKVIASCIDAAEAEGADFAILWTDLYDFYRKMGFELAGSEISLVIENTLPLNNDSQIKYLISEKIAPESILKLYSQHTCGTIRTTEDIRRALSIPNSRVYTAWSPQNQLLAYAVEGKGIDLKGYIHEWGGGVNELLSLFAYIRSDLKKPITIIAPAHAQNLIRRLTDLNVVVSEGFLGMLKIINTKNLFAKVIRYARQLGIDDLVLEKKNSGYAIGTKDDIAFVNDERELVRLLFGPIDQSSLKPKFQKILPVPMWVWGWDSV